MEHLIDLIVGGNDFNVTSLCELKGVLDQIYHDLLEAHMVSKGQFRQFLLCKIGACYKSLIRDPVALHNGNRLIRQCRPLHVALWLENRYYKLKDVCWIEHLERRRVTTMFNLLHVKNVID